MDCEPRPHKSHKQTSEDGREAGLIAGLGASAGGIEPLEQFLAQVPPDTGISFVIVQHLDPRRPSLLVELLGRHAAIPVLEAADGLRPQPNHAYVIAPGTLLELRDGSLQVSQARGARFPGPIDGFFRSLAAEQGGRAAAIVLSGAGNDGTEGLRAVKERGGLTLAQSPETARHDSMPRSAIAAGVVDYVLPPAELAEKLLEHTSELLPFERTSASTLKGRLARRLADLCAVIREHTGHDFAHYKEGTLLRRIERRMLVLRLASVETYLERLRTDAGEAETLAKDLLIGVTHFFRDPEAFEALAQQVIPRLTQNRAPDHPIRIWIAGCASGEEAYSVAILLREHLERLGSDHAVQVFATDLDAEPINQARAGRYPLAIADHVEPERLKRFFRRTDEGYEVTKALRGMCIFSEQSLTRDPPFSQLDLITCRNVLIYFSTALQQKLLLLFHGALRPGGTLFLGQSEGVGGRPELFQTIDASHRIFRRREILVRPAIDFALTARPAPLTPGGTGRARPTTPQRIQAAFEQIVLADYTAPCAVVNENGDLLRLAGRLDRYVRLPAGTPSTNLFELSPALLRIELRMAMRLAAATQGTVVREAVRSEHEEHIRLTVRPLTEVDVSSPLFLVVLQGREPPARPQDPAPVLDAAEPCAVERVEAELRAKTLELQATLESFESANEELQTANEELQASQEELQSLNEELETVNAELRQKLAELAAANSDLRNLFASTDIATLFLDRELRIARFTPAATRLFHLIETDLGRPLADLASPFEHEDLVAASREVLSALATVERQVRTRDGRRWLILRLLPYRTLGDRIEGVVLTFIDISELKRAEEKLRQTTERERFLAETIENATTPFGVGAPDGRLLLFNRAFADLTGYSREELEGASLSWMQDLTPAEWREPEAEALGRAVRERTAVSYQKEYRRKDGTRVPIELTVQPVFDAVGALVHFRAFVRDISERMHAEAELDRLARQRQLALDAARLGWWHLDPATQHASWDAGYARIFGVEGHTRANEEILSQIIHPEDVPGLRASIEAALDPRDPRPFTAEYRINRPDGAMRWVEAHGIVAFDGADDERRAASFVGTVADITERKLADEALRAALVKAEAGDRLLEALMAQVPEGISLCDADGSLRMVSQYGQDLLGGPHTGRNVADVAQDWTVYRPDGETRMPKDELPLLRALGGTTVQDVELVQVSADGRMLRLLCNAAPIRDASGRIVAAVVAWRDISPLKAAEASARESELRLRLALSAAGMVAWEYDPASDVVTYSESVETRPSEPAIQGIDALGFQTQGFDRIHPEDREPHRALVEQAIATGSSYVSVYRQADSEPPVWLEEHAQAVLGQTGQTVRLVGVLQNVTERKQAEAALREAHDTREAILDNMTDGLLIANPDGTVIDINPAAMRLHGFISKSEALRALADYPEIFEVRDLSGQEQPPQAWPLTRAYHGEVFTNHELRVRRRDTGQTFVGSYGGAAVRDPRGRVRFGIITIRDISAQKQAEEQIRQLAFYDALTGLPNRRLLEERLAVALTHVKRDGHCLAVMVLDLDYFKAINDALGHSVGDALLVEAARRMSACMRATDTVARPGGDEFMLVVPGVQADGAAHLAEKLVTRLAEPMRLDGHELTIGCSLGISLAPDDGSLARELIARADTAMYRAKQAGRNRYQFFTEDMQQEALRIMTLEQQLRQALGGTALCLHYQPQIELENGRAIGLEALIRWEHPTHGLLGANGFIPFAEKSGLILDLGAWVLRAVVLQLQAWSHAGLPLLPVAVNLSAQQFRHPDRRRALSQQVSDLLRESGLAPTLLELEITENSLLEETEETLATLQALRALGVRLTLDDFGTGYSSLSTLNAFPVDRLKIDQSFVRAAPDNPKQAAIIETILALGRHLDFEVIAEGVETAEHLEQLRRQGCLQAQGYYFSKPLPPAAVESWLTRCR